MAGRHVREGEKQSRRFWWVWLIAGVAAVALLIGALWGMHNLPKKPAGTAATATTATTTTTVPTTEDPALSTTPPETPPPVREFVRPEQMRGVWLTAGVDYNVSGTADENAVRAELDAALATLKEWSWNTVIVTLPAALPSPDAFDAPAYILEKAREQQLFVYMTVNCGVYDGVLFPTQAAEREQLKNRVTESARRYAADGFLLTGYSYRYGEKPEETGESVNTMLRDAVNAIHAVNYNAYVGLLTEAVWAHSSVQAAGSATENVYEELTDGGADTRRLVLDGAVDFVMVKNFRTTGDYSAAFGTVLNWWNDLCKEANMPLYMAHGATNAAAGERRWSVRDQLARQVLACQKVDGWQGSTFDSLAALNKVGDAASAARQAFDGSLMEEYISRKLTVTEPSSENTTTYSSTINLRGSADPNFPVLLNGEELKLTDHGYFSLDKTLQLGTNTFVFENKGVVTTYKVQYKIAILKSVSPAETLRLDGGAEISVSATAHKGATVYAMINGTMVTMQPAVTQKDEGVPLEDAEYLTYVGKYKLPAGRVGEVQSLGAITFYGSYNGQSETKTGGALTIKALAGTQEPSVEDVTVQELVPINPATGGETLASGTVMIVTTDYAETFNGDTTDDYSRPTNAYLPRGTTDVLAGTAYDASSGRHYYLLGCGRRVYQEDAAVYINGGTLSANTLTVGGVTTSAKGTVLTLGANWRVPFNLQLLPQAYGNPATQDYSSNGQTTEYVDITFSYTTATVGTVDVSSSPLFRAAEWLGSTSTRTLRLYLTKTAQFYGYHVTWDNNGVLTFTFKHPTYVGGNSAEQPLRGFKVVLDPGHGGSSIGTAGGNIPEKNIALTYAALLRNQLEALGATVVMTRTGDSDLSLHDRTVITRASGADLFLSIHMDGSTSASVGGCSVHYFSDYSRGIAESMYNEMTAVYAAYGSNHRRHFRWNPFAVTRISEMPSLLLECGFMTNAQDLELLVSPDFQDALMASVVRSVVAYAQSLPKI
ncbi:MAG: hypothetical protein E7552_07305 [Ruminococcaceae bacterium]|nr:hypothetical protein [Oscillospiraceae bacterium]